ncbi:2-dehydro-3-deoxy-6-phosphogalactonate aldolase [Brooklawnia propionicigenes]|uniref:2-dehydro-3-deoxy-6-phosphogalactonate aldolase n=1 Tax=Brooklawnia propionicigenes TaxID=3041175 RepID=A0AAN0MH81_9ACTN|nr:2-dehydro-3-deoxy-6-phosphogalactonate aldolase [Brooklawnia sp. SH051]BEH02713.1 2-dehydro-3-deoxy-6-phosphogalactonate aldolase [Brooklawnia sp. SH051]
MGTEGLIAILRGLRPDEAAEIGEAVLAGGVTTLEVPLNSPSPLASIAILREQLGDRATVGAGTVLTPDDVVACRRAGAQIIVSPNCEPSVIARAVDLGMTPFPGVATVSEAFTAINAGARHLKLFPANVLGVASMKAWRDVLPAAISMLPVGGMDASTVGEWAAAGAAGAGFGSSLYKAGRSAEEVTARTAELVRAWLG